MRRAGWLFTALLLACAGPGATPQPVDWSAHPWSSALSNSEREALQQDLDALGGAEQLHVLGCLAAASRAPATAEGVQLAVEGLFTCHDAVFDPEWHSSAPNPASKALQTGSQPLLMQKVEQAAIDISSRADTKAANKLRATLNRLSPPLRSGLEPALRSLPEPKD